MLKFLEKFEHWIVNFLIVLMAVVVLLSTAELGYEIVRDVFTPPVGFLDIDELLGIFGSFLLVLIGVELLEILRAYLKEDAVHVEVVFAVALIAIARKVIILDVKDLPSQTLVGIAAIIAVLSIGYYLIKRTHHEYQDRPR
jgi:uncharacterized membrane protein (DUF373 family)